MTSTDYYSETGSLIKAYDAEEPRQLRYFSFFAAVSQVFGFLMLFLTGYWNGNWQGGYEWGPNIYLGQNASGYPIIQRVRGNWHYHSTFMTYGMVFLQGEAILMYRLFRHERKIFSKFLHGLFHLFVMTLFIFGLIAVIQNKKNAGNDHMFTAHSWLGATVVVSFTLQYIAGFICFGFPKASAPVRAWYLPVHRACGLIIFGVSCAQTLSGYIEQTWISYAYYSAAFNNCYNTLDCHGEAFVLNFNILSLVIYAISVIYLATSKKYIRQKTIDEEGH